MLVGQWLACGPHSAVWSLHVLLRGKVYETLMSVESFLYVVINYVKVN